MKNSFLCNFIFFLLFCSLAIFTLVVGETPWNVVWKDALNKLKGISFEWNPLLDERLPRLIVLINTGASLAVSGAVMQSIFQNPLASPSILGISCGGSLFVILILILEWQLDYPYAIPLGAFGGSLLTLILVYLLSKKRGIVTLNDLVLNGIAVSSLIFTIQETLMYVLRDRWQLIQTLTEWQAGTTIDRNWDHVHMQLPLTLIGIIGCWSYRSELNLLSLGEEEAKNLGVDVKKIRWRLFLFVSMLIGGALAAVGMIAFFGLILPHMMRWFSGPDNRRLIPHCIIGGSTIMLMIDSLIRLLPSHTFSIGNVSSVLGAIFFLILLYRKRQQEDYTSC